MERDLKRRDVIWSYIGQIANLGIHIILTPVIAVKLASSELGLWYTFTSIFTLVTFFDTSFSPLLLKNASFCYSGAANLTKMGIPEKNSEGKPNVHLLEMLCRVSRRLYACIGGVITVFLLSAGSLYIKYITKTEYKSIYLYSWYIYVIGIGIYICAIFFPAILKGIGKIVKAQKILALSRIFQFIISVILLLLDYGIFALAISFFIGNFLIGFLSLLAYIKETRLFSNQILDRKKEKYILEILWFNAKKMLLTSIGRYLGMQGNTLVCSTFLSLETAGRYGLTVQALQAVTSIGAIYLQSAIPVISGAYVSEHIKKIKTYFCTGLLIQWGVTIAGETAIILFANRILMLIGANTRVLSTPLLLLLSLCYFVLSNYMDCGLMIESKNQIPHMWAETISGLLTVVLSVIGVLLWKNILPLVIIQTIVPCLYNGWKWPHKVWKELDLDFQEVMKNGYDGILNIILKK